LNLKTIFQLNYLFIFQLEKLLNKPCSHPDFVKPFKIDVIDALEDVSKTFSVGKMIDGVFNMCFKIKTSDDPIEKSIEVSAPQNETNDEEIVEITPNPVPVQTSKLTLNCSRGNFERQSQIFNSRKAKQTNHYALTYPNNDMRIQDTQRLHNSSSQSMHLQSLSTLTNSVTHSMQQMPNHFTQTGIATNPHNPVVTSTVSQMSYASPQVYRGPNSNQINKNSLLNSTSVQKQQNYVRQLSSVQYPNPPNVTVQSSMPFTTGPIRVQSIQQMPQQQQLQQTPFK